ncbi:MAG: hypothetical protein HQ582_16165 [Planctomycetes bacterium]|nr:hypothetical protein [Planctomycetota bacterium]
MNTDSTQGRGKAKRSNSDGSSAVTDRGELVSRSEEAHAETPQPSRQIRALTKASQALAAANTLHEIKDIRDQAEAVRMYARSAAMGLEVQNKAAEIKLRAERKAGKFLAEGIRRGGNRRSKLHDATLNLSDLGVTKLQSHRWQLEASVSDAHFERYVDGCQTSGKELTSATLLRFAKSHPGEEGGNSHEEVQTGLDGMTEGVVRLIERGQHFGCIWATPLWLGSALDVAGCPDRSAFARSAQLRKLAVRDVVAEQAHLHIAVPAEFLGDAMLVINAWGFTYRSVLVSKESPRGYGEYWRPGHEFLLLGVRGRLPFRDSGLIGGLEAEDSSVAGRPGLIRQLIERVSPGPYLGLFGGEFWPGWTVLTGASAMDAEAM